MAEISAAAVKALRERTGLPMMDCKRALEEAGGDPDAAVEVLRKAGKKTMEKRTGREMAAGRIAIDAQQGVGVGTIVELLCESAPVATNEDFIALAHDMARQLALGPGADTPDALLDQPSPRKAGETLRQQFEDLNNRIREVFKLSRIARIDAGCAGYVHHNGSVGVLLEYEGGTPEVAKDVCMHVAAMRPSVVSVEDLDPELLAKEREIQKEIARQEGKPESIIDKMIEGRMRNFYAESCLLEQPFVKDDKKTVGAVAKDAGMKVIRFLHWELGKE